MKPYGIGIDIIETLRIASAMKKNPGFAARFFSPEEIKYCRKYKNSAERFAAKFAAKEAVVKALGDKKIPLKDIEILNELSGKPAVRLKKNKNFIFMISVSHSKAYACAVCAVYGKKK